MDINWNNSPQHPYSAIVKLFPDPLCHRNAKTQRYCHSVQGCRPFGESLASTAGRQEAPSRQDYSVSLGGAYADVSWSNWLSRTSANGKLLWVPSSAIFANLSKEQRTAKSNLWYSSKSSARIHPAIPLGIPRRNGTLSRGRVGYPGQPEHNLSVLEEE